MNTQPPKICVYAIAKNEAKHVYRWHERVAEADRVVVVDTGSEDSTVSKLKKCSVEVHHYNFPNFAFHTARNQALYHCPPQPQAGREWVYVWLDLDELLEVGWADKLRNAVMTSEPYVNAWNFRLVNGTTSYNRMAAHRERFVWKYHAHEVLDCTTGLAEAYTDIEVHHLPDLDKPRNYLSLLKESAETYRDARSYRYYARECSYFQQYDKAIEMYGEAVKLEENPLLECEIYIELGNCMYEVNQIDNAKRSYLYAAWNAPYVREGWGALANFCFTQRLFDEAISAIYQMMYVTEMPTHTIMRFDPYYREWPYHMLASCYQYLGNIDKAKEYITTALSLSPRDPAILRDFALINGLTYDTLTITET